METIKNYLDTMFANLPNTASVLKAKDELWQMMEDKYNELLSEGKTENEAVGTVISEFGNLNELAEALGLENEVKKNDSDSFAENESKKENAENKAENKDSATFKSEYVEPEIIINATEAEELLKQRAEGSTKIGLGVGICILSPVGGILTELFLHGRYDFIGFIFMALIIAAGVVMIVLGAGAMEGWSNYKNKKTALSMDATKLVADERAVYERNHTLTFTIGILLCVVSWIPAAIIDEVLPRFSDASGATFFIAVAIGVVLIIYSSMRKSGYEALLKLNGTGTIKAAYEPEDDSNFKYVNKTAEFCMSVYWPTLVCLYLILSFVTFKWGITWIIWPVAGVLHGPLKKALRAKD
ncbi:MAG: permease prefix domain 1-containing protein [Lachnospiraceae bacterium]|nr:permease prefix domain 1-containing protein [Lachnospiraceae bacterium]